MDIEFQRMEQNMDNEFKRMELLIKSTCGGYPKPSLSSFGVDLGSDADSSFDGGFDSRD